MSTTVVQEVLIVCTESDSLKASIYGWSIYDPSLMKPQGTVIGLSGVIQKSSS